MEKYLPRCIESILGQTYSDLEVILVDDGSTDDSGKICDEYARRDPRITVIHKENGGLSSARNAGLDRCTGSFVTFVDSDDWIERNMYESMMSGDHYDMTVCGYYLYSSEAGDPELVDPWSDRGERRFVTKDGYHDVLCRTIVVWNKILAKERIGDARFSQKHRTTEDILFVCDMLKNVKEIKIIREPYYNYFAGRPGNVVSSQVDDRTFDLLSVAKLIYDDLKGTDNASCGVFRIKCGVDAVWRKLARTEGKAQKKLVDGCAETIRYPAIADIAAFMKDRKFGAKSKAGFLLNYFMPRFYGKLKYKVQL